MRYKDIRKITKIRPIYQEMFFVYFFGRRLSPFFVNIFLNFKTKPNTVTIYMIITGIIGAILFTFDNIWFKFVGYIFILIWLILDCADGEVARITKIFSKFGKELDYIAHIINHPLFCISFLISLIQLNKYGVKLLAIITIILITNNLIYRNLLSINIIYNLKEKQRKVLLKKRKLPKIIIIFRTIISYLLRILIQIPNFALIFPLTYFIDISVGTHWSLVYFVIVTVSSLLFTLKSTIKIICKIIKK